MPQCDSSVTCMRAVWPKPSLADLLPDWRQVSPRSPGSRAWSF